MRFGTVAIVGRSNVGKSTLLNALLGEPLAIVSPLPQTTREPLLGVLNVDDAQLAFVDTPGLHQPRSELGRRMNSAAVDTANRTDVILFMTDTRHLAQRKKVGGTAPPVPQGDQRLLATLPPGVPTIAVINKMDTLRRKELVLPMLDALNEARDFCALLPVSVLHDDGVDAVLAELLAALPEGPRGYDEDTLTDRSLVFFVREYVREQVLQQTKGEVPHAVAITVDRFHEGKGGTKISATIHVEKPGQRGILIGKQGQMLRSIGTSARERIAPLVGTTVHLDLLVRVTPRWKNAPRKLAELGYET